MKSITAARWLTHLMRQLPAARLDGDADAVHELRTSIARLRVLLALGCQDALDGELKWLRDSVGDVRDLDVQIAHEPPASVAFELRAARELAQADLRRALDDPRLSQLLDELATLRPVSVEMAEHRLKRLVRRALKLRRKAKRKWKKAVSVHKLRRALRDVRYSLEWLARPADTLAKAQHKLGGVVDRVAALRRLDELSLNKPYEKKLRRELREKLRKARRASSGKMAKILQKLLVNKPAHGS
jgi:hypothetical protein